MDFPVQGAVSRYGKLKILFEHTCMEIPQKKIIPSSAVPITLKLFANLAVLLKGVVT